MISFVLLYCPSIPPFHAPSLWLGPQIPSEGIPPVRKRWHTFIPLYHGALC